MFRSTKHSNNWKQKQDGQLVIIIIDKATFIVSITFIIFGVAFVVIVFSESSFSDGKWRYFVGLVHAQTCTASSLTSSKDHHFFVFHYHHHKRLVTSHHNHHQKQSLSIFRKKAIIILITMFAFPITLSYFQSRSAVPNSLNRQPGLPSIIARPCLAPSIIARPSLTPSIKLPGHARPTLAQFNQRCHGLEVLDGVNDAKFWKFQSNLLFLV